MVTRRSDALRHRLERPPAVVARGNQVQAADIVAVPFDNIDHRCALFATAIRALAQLETDRSKFILEAYRRGRSDEFRLDDEAVRPIVLPLLHQFFDRAQHAWPEGQHHYEQAIQRRDEDRLPTSTIRALDYLLKQDDMARLEKFIAGRPQAEIAKICGYVRKKTDGRDNP
jgi:hypothetical protein